jgi:Acyl-CoA dehydrogenase N terminal
VSAGQTGSNDTVNASLLSRRDLDFLLFEWLRVDELTKRQRFADHTPETFADVLTLCEDLAERYFAPHYKLSNIEEPAFDGENVTMLPEVKEALRIFGDAELLGMKQRALS